MDDVLKRTDSVADLEAPNSWLRFSGWAHLERIAVMGPSYGGFMVRLANKLRAYPAVADFLNQHLQGANG